MSGGSNQQYPPMGGEMGGGPQSGGPPMITGGPYQGSPQMSRPGFGVGGPDDPAMGGSGYYGGGGMPPIPPRWGGGRPEHTYWPQLGGGGGFQANPTKPGGGGGNWAGLGQGFSQDQFMKAKSFADRGKMGRASQAIQQGGGQWSPQLQGLLGSPSGQWGNMSWDTMA